MGEVYFEEDREPLLDPDAICDGCGANGTVSRDDAYLTQLAQEMQQSAAWRVGRMPIRVLAFIQQYGAAHDVVGRRGR